MTAKQPEDEKKRRRELMERCKQHWQILEELKQMRVLLDALEGGAS